MLPETAENSAPVGHVHTLSLRLSDQDYRRLRRFVAVEEDKSGRRLTHQAVLETALRQFLERV